MAAVRYHAAMLRNLGLTSVLGDAKLWRYMNLSQFLWLLSERSLYFAPLADFEDKWEGTPPSQSLEAFRHEQVARGQDLGATANASAIGNFYVTSARNQLRKVGEAYRVICWHESNVESVAMWKLYTRGNDGVAIQTTVARMESCLSSLSFVGVGRVDYSGHEPDQEGERPKGLPLSLLKRRSFAHEQEVRVFMHNFDRPDLAKFWDKEFSEGKKEPPGGVVKVDIGHLIERIIASPDYPAWAVPGLQAIVTAAGVNVQVESSDLLKLPEK
jgi:hypothetical protein